MWQLTAFPLAAGAALRVLVVLYVQAVHGNFLFLDDQGYDQIGWSLASAWRHGSFPAPSSVQYAGTLSYLYYVFVAAVYFVAGHHWVVWKVLAALASALSVPAAAAFGDGLGGRRLATGAAWLAALYPNALFWGASGLKDGPLTTLLLALAALALRPLTIERLAAAAAIITVAFLSRPVLGIAGLAMLAVPASQLALGRWPGHRHPMGPGSRLFVLLAGIPVAAVGLGYLATQYLPLLKSILVGDSALALGNGPVTVSFTPAPKEVLRSLLGPFPWAFGPASDTVYRALYPGMVVWIVLLPAVALGCWEVLRRGPWAARGVVVSALCYLYLYASVFQSQGFFRQRYTVEILLLVLGLHAFARRPQEACVWTALGASVVAPAALVQAGALPRAGLVLIPLAVGALWLPGIRACIRRVTGAPGRRWRARGARAAGAHHG